MRLSGKTEGPATFLIFVVGLPLAYYAWWLIMKGVFWDLWVWIFGMASVIEVYKLIGATLFTLIVTAVLVLGIEEEKHECFYYYFCGDDPDSGFILPVIGSRIISGASELLVLFPHDPEKEQGGDG